MVDPDGVSPASCINTEAIVTPDLLGSSDDGARMMSALDAVEIHDCRPTHDAFTLGLQALAETPAGAERAMVLITDGLPTTAQNCAPGDCNSTLPGAAEALLDDIAEALGEQQVRTFVIGLPGSEDAREWLSQASEAGGTSAGSCGHVADPYCHIDLTGAGSALRDSLGGAWRQVIGEVRDCTIPLPAPPDGSALDPNAIMLVLWPNGGEPIWLFRSGDSDCDQGWYLEEATQTIRLCTDSCRIVQSDPWCSLQVQSTESGGFLPPD
jgi:hypothetical protein